MAERRIYFNELGTPKLLEFLRENFIPGLEGTTVVKLSERDPEAEFNWSEIYIVDEKFLVKEVLHPVMNANLDYVAKKYDVLQHMRFNDVPVVMPLMSRQGLAFAQVRTNPDDDPHLVEVTPYLLAERFSETHEQIADLGDAVGRITKAFLTLPSDVEEVIGARTSIFQGYTGPDGRTFDQELDGYEKEAGNIDGWLGDEVRRIIPWARKEYERISASPTFPVPEYGIPKGLVHGDIHHFNTLFDKKSKRLAAVIDWDSMAEKVRVQDAALSMERFAIVMPDRKVSHVDRAEVFYKAFTQYYQPTPEEEAHMFDALADYYLPNVCGILRDVFQGGRDWKYPIYLAVLNPERIRNLEKDLFGR